MVGSRVGKFGCGLAQRARRTVHKGDTKHRGRPGEGDRTKTSLNPFLTQCFQCSQVGFNEKGKAIKLLKGNVSEHLYDPEGGRLTKWDIKSLIMKEKVIHLYYATIKGVHW